MSCFMNLRKAKALGLYMQFMMIPTADRIEPMIEYANQLAKSSGVYSLSVAISIIYYITPFGFSYLSEVIWPRITLRIDCYALFDKRPEEVM
ncbi:hypothetical protein F5Y10DRAFT_260067 [Nemania abortiva]|nr:hypothetical protein F5Y10DRAFT_260067 [Nemania abortiva]